MAKELLYSAFKHNGMNGENTDNQEEFKETSALDVLKRNNCLINDNLDNLATTLLSKISIDDFCFLGQLYIKCFPNELKKKRKHKHPEIDTLFLSNLRLQGKNISQISREYNLSRTTIYKRIKGEV